MPQAHTPRRRQRDPRRVEDVALTAPAGHASAKFLQRLKEMEAQGIVSHGSHGPLEFKPLARKPGALKRFLESRE